MPSVNFSGGTRRHTLGVMAFTRRHTLGVTACKRVTFSEWHIKSVALEIHRRIVKEMVD